MNGNLSALALLATALFFLAGCDGQQSAKPTTGKNDPEPQKAAPPPSVKEPAVKKRSDSGRPPKKDWRPEAAAELEAAIKQYPKLEPLPKPPQVTQQVYEHYLIAAARLTELWYSPKDAFSYYTHDVPGADVLAPRAYATWKREALRQQAETTRQEDVEKFVAKYPRAKPLLDPKTREDLRKRPLADQRKQKFAEFAELTGDKSPWSLWHPFDDLTEFEMDKAIEMARLAKANGLGALSPSDRQLLLTAGAIEFFDRLLKQDPGKR